MAATRPSQSPTTHSDRVAQPSAPEACIDDNDRLGIELCHIETHEDLDEDSSDASLSSGEEYRMAPRRTASRASEQSGEQASSGLWGRIAKHWTEHVVLTVPQKHNRDYLGELNRASSVPADTRIMIKRQDVSASASYRLSQHLAVLHRPFLEKPGNTGVLHSTLISS